ncbi:hypothetical protein H5410_051737 [Solanum commersonii]|uniref:Cytochrome c oxidase subunit 3 n=1 Tax=Solanum commersonii TaxID=4109 RepID=A0A9J5X1L4_SOLCO|nr:hypothetical protein H5410_051737 [Solanum commersonii]
MIESQRNSYHLVDPNPWPISSSLGAFATTVGGVMYMHSFQGGATHLSLGLIFLLYTMFVWWRDVLRASTGYVLFCSFWASSHYSLAPMEILFLNTLILLSSGAPVTWAHHAILAGKKKRAVYALLATVSLALVFKGF